MARVLVLLSQKILGRSAVVDNMRPARKGPLMWGRRKKGISLGFHGTYVAGGWSMPRNTDNRELTNELGVSSSLVLVPFHHTKKCVTKHSRTEQYIPPRGD